MVIELNEIVKALSEGKTYDSIFSEFETVMNKAQEQFNAQKLEEEKRQAEAEAAKVKNKVIRQKAKEVVIAAIEFLKLACPEDLIKDVDFDAVKIDEIVDSLVETVDEVVSFANMLTLASKINKKDSEKDNIHGVCFCDSCDTQCNECDGYKREEPVKTASTAFGTIDNASGSILDIFDMLSKL